MTNDYSQLIGKFPQTLSPTKIAESTRPYHVFTERHLQAMWLEQKYFKDIKLHDDTPIMVISPGIWNSEAGPDFLKAHIKIGNKEYFGDIELHLSQEGWTQHHHDKDPLYDNVVLHVCYWEPTTYKKFYTSKQDPIATTFLQSRLTVPESRIIKLIDLDLYPYKIFSGVGRCSRALFNKLSKEQITSFFHMAAEWRLQEKWRRLVESVDDPARCLERGIAMTLGYKQNAEAFITLNKQLEKHENLSESIIFSNCLAASGFFAPHFQKKWGSSPFYQTMITSSKASNLNLPSVSLKLDHIRPANHPIRRLALLTKIIRDNSMKTLGTRIVAAWNHATTTQNWLLLRKHLLEIIPDYNDAYWNYHYTFETHEQKQAIRLLGESLREEILINVFLPFLFSMIKKEGEERTLKAFNIFYSTIPPGKTKKSAYLSHRFFGDNAKKECLSYANTQQGAYQVHKDFCIHFEASCQGCPFVEMYEETFNIPLHKKPL